MHNTSKVANQLNSRAATKLWRPSGNPIKSASDPDTIESGTIVRVAVPGIGHTESIFFSKSPTIA